MYLMNLTNEFIFMPLESKFIICVNSCNRKHKFEAVKLYEI